MSQHPQQPAEIDLDALAARFPTCPRGNLLGFDWRNNEAHRTAPTYYHFSTGRFDTFDIFNLIISFDPSLSAPRLDGDGKVVARDFATLKREVMAIISRGPEREKIEAFWMGVDQQVVDNGWSSDLEDVRYDSGHPTIDFALFYQSTGPLNHALSTLFTRTNCAWKQHQLEKHASTPPDADAPRVATAAELELDEVDPTTKEHADLEVQARLARALQDASLRSAGKLPAVDPQFRTAGSAPRGGARPTSRRNSATSLLSRISAPSISRTATDRSSTIGTPHDVQPPFAPGHGRRSPSDSTDSGSSRDGDDFVPRRDPVLDPHRRQPSPSFSSISHFAPPPDLGGYKVLSADELTARADDATRVEASPLWHAIDQQWAIIRAAYVNKDPAYDKWLDAGPPELSKKHRHALLQNKIGIDLRQVYAYSLGEKPRQQRVGKTKIFVEEDVEPRAFFEPIIHRRLLGIVADYHSRFYPMCEALWKGYIGDIDMYHGDNPQHVQGFIAFDAKWREKCEKRSLGLTLADHRNDSHLHIAALQHRAVAKRRSERGTSPPPKRTSNHRDPEVCGRWNDGREDAPAGGTDVCISQRTRRAHACSECGAAHRRCDGHPEFAPALGVGDRAPRLQAGGGRRDRAARR